MGIPDPDNTQARTPGIFPVYPHRYHSRYNLKINPDHNLGTALSSDAPRNGIDGTTLPNRSDAHSMAGNAYDELRAAWSISIARIYNQPILAALSELPASDLISNIPDKFLYS